VFIDIKLQQRYIPYACKQTWKGYPLRKWSSQPNLAPGFIVIIAACPIMVHSTP